MKRVYSVCILIMGMALPWPSYNLIKACNWRMMCTYTCPLSQFLNSFSLLLVAAACGSTRGWMGGDTVQFGTSLGLWTRRAERANQSKASEPRDRTRGATRVIPSHHIQYAFYLLVCTQRGTYPSAPAPALSLSPFSFPPLALPTLFLMPFIMRWSHVLPLHNKNPPHCHTITAGQEGKII